MRITQFIKKNRLCLIGGAIGAAGGYLYYVYHERYLGRCYGWINRWYIQKREKK